LRKLVVNKSKISLYIIGAVGPFKVGNTATTKISQTFLIPLPKLAKISHQC